MNFTGNENHAITLAEAAVMTKNYRNQNPGDILGVFYGKIAIEPVLAQPGCVGIRYYNAINNNNPTVVLIGVDANQNVSSKRRTTDSTNNKRPKLS